MDWKSKFEAGLTYDAFLDTYGTDEHRARWAKARQRFSLPPEDAERVRGFVRTMNVLCLAGAWCGDCVEQCPILRRIADESETIDLRFLDRDEHSDLQEMLSINGGSRVPVAVFLSEDFYECGRFGERTLSRYRDLASRVLGAACPTGIGSGDPQLDRAVVREWVDVFERVQWMLRLSPRLREKHGD